MTSVEAPPPGFGDWQTYTTADRTGWESGPWRDEPDKVTWIDPATDLDCMVRRGPLGFLCGYVGVGPDHPWHGVTSDDVPAEAHGGLTYANACWGDEATGICHTPAPGRTHDVWWIGFDCGHAGDLCPQMNRYTPALSYEVYRTIAYVRSEVEALAAQAAAAVAPSPGRVAPQCP